MNTAFSRDPNSFPLSPDYVADPRQDCLAAWDKLSPDGDIGISEKSIACCCCVPSLSHAGDRSNVGHGLASGRKCLALNDYQYMARSLRQIGRDTRFAWLHSSIWN